MAFRLSPQADANLSDLWWFVAGEERADALVDAITDAPVAAPLDITEDAVRLL